MNPKTVRRWISVWLLVQVAGGAALLLAPAKRVQQFQMADRRWAAVMILLLAVTGCVLLTRTKRHQGPVSWRALSWFFGVTGACMAIGYAGGLMFGVDASAAKALMAVASLGVFQLMVWGKLREARTEKIWEQERASVAPVFD